MTDSQSSEMDADERDAFLGTGGTGVISFSGQAESPPHSVPVSYGYDGDENTFYFRLAIGGDTGKGEPAGRHATFVVYGQADDDWQSVVAKGQLEETTEEPIANESLQGLKQVHIPIVDVFDRPVKDVSFRFYRLAPEELTGRQETSKAQ